MASFGKLRMTGFGGAQGDSLTGREGVGLLNKDINVHGC